MSTHAAARFAVRSWDEVPYSEVAGGSKLTRAAVTQAYRGDLEGEGMVQYLMAYREDGTADFVSLERVAGSLDGQTGSFVLAGSGTFDDAAARGSWRVVPGSANGALRGLHGDGTFAAAHGEPQGTVAFNYDFE
ncbi:MAG: DUF3224 domain-containing protein [Dehalococcoidia bacterium]|nr:DUF3224 domain-containing protein [Dehalococcoidia bacterium]